jgi:hypothetical protein
MLDGSCLCGAVKYQVEGHLGPIVCCHCSMCRKAQGTAFATNAPVEAARFRITKGEQALRAYSSSPGKWRCFCSICGSPVFSKLESDSSVIRLRIGTLDARIQERPSAHIHVASKAEWFEILDGLPQYPELEPGR